MLARAARTSEEIMSSNQFKIIIIQTIADRSGAMFYSMNVQIYMYPNKDLHSFERKKC